jgi:hypothetical protein
MQLGALWMHIMSLITHQSMAQEKVPFFMEHVYPIDNEPKGSHQQWKGYV